MNFKVVIPARYASTRLPAKPLLDLGGKPMVVRVAERAALSGAEEVWVATDHAEVLAAARAHGLSVVLTRADHPSGTDRCYEALTLVGRDRFDAVVKIQGDEPFVVPEQIDQLCAALRVSGGIATLAQVVTDDRDLDDPGEVHITTDVNMDALYFSRAAIPFLRDGGSGPRHARFRYLKHVGLYGYRADVLQRIVALPPSALEKAESLEQLRWVENGFKVRIGLTEHPSFCVDTPADLEEARRRVAVP